MRNMNTNEMRLYNVVDDYREEHDLAPSMPEKVASMDQILRAYVDEVDGGDVKDSYQAFYATMDEFERREDENFPKRMADLEAKMPADYEEQKAKLIAEHERKKRSFNANRAITKRQETWPDWYSTARKTVEAEIGMNKGGKLLKKK